PRHAAQFPVQFPYSTPGFWQRLIAPLGPENPGRTGNGTTDPTNGGCGPPASGRPDASFRLGEAAPGNRIGQLLEHRDGVFPADAGVRDALAVGERLARLQVLPPGHQVALDHEPEDPVLAA